MTYTFRPAIREQTPLIVGIAGPTKSGKTYSALRLAAGLGQGGVVAMLNAEGPRGHQYAEKFKYVACDLEPPYRPESYTAALAAAAKLNPAVVIIDSASHMHDGPGGMIEYHEEELDRMVGKTDFKARQRATFAAWVNPKKAENAFIYQMLGMKCPVILCFRAKEKIKIVPGKEPVDLGWQPIAGERVAFETIFTLMLPPHSKGVPDLAISDMREPFDEMVPRGKAIDEALGLALAKWARGAAAAPGGASAPPASGAGTTHGPAPARVEPSSPRAESTAATPAAAPAVDDPVAQERALWLEKIDAAAALLKLEGAEKVGLWNKYVGAGIKRDKADPTQLEELYRDLERRPGAAA